MPETTAGKATPLFLLGFHRGGSTFVQRLLNCHSNVVIWGENGGILSVLRSFHETYAKSPAHAVDTTAYRAFDDFAERFVPWANPVGEGELASHIAQLVESAWGIPGDGYWGFKEIRHGSVDDIGFLFRLFGSCQVALLVRHPKDILLSDFHVSWTGAKNADSVEAFARGFLAGYVAKVDAFVASARDRPSQVAILRYETIRDEVAVSNLFGALGIPLDGLNDELVAKVLSARAGSSFRDVGRQVSDDDERAIRDCYEELIGPSLVDASEAARDALLSWYPDLNGRSEPQNTELQA